MHSKPALLSPRRAALGVVLAALLGAAASPASANLLVNGDFATSTEGWACVGDGTDTWVTRDLDDSLGSGSLQVTNVASTNNSILSCLQCVALDASSEFRLSSWTYWPQITRGIAIGSTRIAIGFFGGPDCTGPNVFEGLTIDSPPFNAWTLVETPWVARPEGAVSALAQITTWANDMGVPVVASYDGVELLGDRIFEDGFEDEDVCAWSSAVSAPPC